MANTLSCVRAGRFTGCCVRAGSKHITPPHRVTGKDIIETLKFSYGTEAALRVNAPGLMVKKKRGWVSAGPILLLRGLPALYHVVLVLA